MYTKEQIKETIIKCAEYKKKHPGTVFGKDFGELAEILLVSPEFLGIVATCITENSIWMMRIVSKGLVDVDEHGFGISSKDLLGESEMFKWLSRAVYLGVQLERSGKGQAAIDSALKSIEDQLAEGDK